MGNNEGGGSCVARLDCVLGRLLERAGRLSAILDLVYEGPSEDFPESLSPPRLPLPNLSHHQRLHQKLPRSSLIDEPFIEEQEHQPSQSLEIVMSLSRDRSAFERCDGCPRNLVSSALALSLLRFGQEKSVSNSMGSISWATIAQQAHLLLEKLPPCSFSSFGGGSSPPPDRHTLFFSNGPPNNLQLMDILDIHHLQPLMANLEKIFGYSQATPKHLNLKVEFGKKTWDLDLDVIDLEQLVQQLSEKLPISEYSYQIDVWNKNVAEYQVLDEATFQDLPQTQTRIKITPFTEDLNQ